MLEVVRNGSGTTAMRSFANMLTPAEQESVVDFIRTEFMQQQAENTRYHTAENGWPDHQRYRAAYPFAVGTLPLDTPDTVLTPAQRQGKRLFLSSCISCHDRSRVTDEGVIWDKRALSYPRRHYSHRDAPPASHDSVSSATPYAMHDIPPSLSGLTTQQLSGETLFQANCAFCHGADGSGQNWIGTFLEPHPRDLRNPLFMLGMTQARLKQAIENGLPATSMPAWKGVLQTREIDDIISYIAVAFHPLSDSPPQTR